MPLIARFFLGHPSNPPTGCDTPPSCLLFTDISVRHPILQHIARYLCDTPGKQARKHFAILSLKVSRDMKSIAAGPLRSLSLLEFTPRSRLENTHQEFVSKSASRDLFSTSSVCVFSPGRADSLCLRIWGAFSLDFLGKLSPKKGEIRNWRDSLHPLPRRRVKQVQSGKLAF